jgi:hypothetical protein
VFLALLFATIASTLWVEFSRMRFIASQASLISGTIYALSSGALFWALARRIGAKHAVIVSLVMSGFGFIAVSQGAAFVYTSALGVPRKHKYTVHSSYYDSSAKYSCHGYRVQFSGVFWLAISSRFLCTTTPIPTGTQLTISGPESSLGQIAKHIEFDNGRSLL